MCFSFLTKKSNANNLVPLKNKKIGKNNEKVLPMRKKKIFNIRHNLTHHTMVKKMKKKVISVLKTVFFVTKRLFY